MSETCDALRPYEVTVIPPEHFDASIWFIGRIHSPWVNRAECPKRGDAKNGPVCQIEIFDPWVEAMDGLAEKEHLQVLYWMHLALRNVVRQNPRNDDQTTGTFAIRSPLRPNPIASSNVSLLGIEGRFLIVRGLDCISGTPLVDLKPLFGVLP